MPFDRSPEYWQAALDARVHQLMLRNEVGVEVHASPARLQRAQRAVARLTQKEFPAVFIGGLLLPKAQRRALSALGAFLRRSDTLSEQPGEQAQAQWRSWCEQALAPNPPDDDALLAFAQMRVDHRIPKAWVQAELDGLDGDHRAPKLATIDALMNYCFDVLAPMGLIMLRTIGADDHAAVFAARFTVALQLSDVLCDIDEDLDEGRVHLPSEELEAAGIPPARLREHLNSEGWRSLMALMLSRCRRLYRSAEPGLRMLPLPGAIAASVIGALYLCQLKDLESSGYDIRRPSRPKLRYMGAAVSAVLRVIRQRLPGGAERSIWAEAAVSR